MITSVDLFFKSKPSSTLNSSGSSAPGVSVKLCNVTNDTPDVTTERASMARVEYGSILAVSDASISTPFTFDVPIVVKTGFHYAFIVRFDDPAYVLWSNKTGDVILGTATVQANNSTYGVGPGFIGPPAVSPGPTTSRDSRLFIGYVRSPIIPTVVSANTAPITIIPKTPTSTTNNLTPSTSVSLKYRVNIAKFNTGATVNVDMFNKNYEFLTINTRVGSFKIGETLFVSNTQYSGTIAVTTGNTTVTGTGTTFTSLVIGQNIIIQSGGSYTISTVLNVANTTSLTLLDPINVSNAAAVFFKGTVGQLIKDNLVTNKIVIRDSSANSTINYSGGATVRGATSNATATVASVDNISVDTFVSHINVVSSSVSTSSAQYSLAQANGANFGTANTFLSLNKDSLIDVGAVKRYILSRSNEATQSQLFQPDLKSADVRLALGTSNPYIAPYLNSVDADLTVSQMLVSNTVYDVANNDTEVTGHGIAFTRHFTNKMTFEKDRQAEDIRVFASIYRPAGTDVRVYAKIWNAEDAEPFDDKLWTLLEHKNGRDNIYSSIVNKTNFIDYEFGFPASAEFSSILAGGFSGATGNNVITGTNTVDLTTVLSAGAYVSVYDPLFPVNEAIVRVQSVTSTTVTLSSNMTATFTGRSVRILKYPTAFVNLQTTGGVVRYFNNTGSQFDGYNTVQIKIVLLANDSHVVPVVDEIEVIGVSA